MFDIGWSELFVIGIVALVVIGPKDLPKALRAAGFWVRKARQISGEFRASVDQMMRESELDEVRQQIKKAAEIDLDKEFRETVDPKGELAEALKPPDLSDITVEPPKLIEAEPPRAAPALTAPEPARNADPSPDKKAASG
jgi:sec-independent protein translocase protein TatB